VVGYPSNNLRNTNKALLGLPLLKIGSCLTS